MAPYTRDKTETVLAMVGLPARGKTYIAGKVARYLRWIGHSTRSFNVGSYRRRLLGSRQTHEFFDPENLEARQALLDMATVALDDMLAWFREGGEVGIYDATNTTRVRRKLVTDRCRDRGIPVVFIESVCNDPALIEATVRETKLKSPDYENVDPDEAVRDFRARIAHYEQIYEPIDDPDASYIKIIDVGRQLVLNRIGGYLPARLVPLLIDMHVTPRPIFLTRHGESRYNEKGLIGGDSELSPRGEQYAKSLAEFMRFELPWSSPLAVWTSTLRRTIQTAQPLTSKPRVWRALDELDAGVCDGMTYDEIRVKMPEIFDARSADKFRYRYPRGESYEDVIQRLDPLLIQLERQRSPVLVIAHQAVLRALYAYFMDLPSSECSRLPIPLHTVIRLTPTAYGCEERRFALPPHVSKGDARGEAPS
ncbi:MAG: 6-phosphofructo-2-kinase/fructose-2,6-bisphosphatase [Polyangiaceae bacterium]|nr:6-phosphofructo-2-kinase/fructose-2,6-bisphosphatase [Polyangiaceae bacterium]